MRERPADCVLDADDCARVCARGSGHIVVAASPTTRAAEGAGASSGSAVLSSSIAIETLGGVATSLIPRCRLLPVEVVETFSTAEDNQTRIEIHLVSGEASHAADGHSLARFFIEGIRPAARGVPVIGITIGVDRSGVVTVTAQDEDTGARQTVIVAHPDTP